MSEYHSCDGSEVRFIFSASSSGELRIQALAAGSLSSGARLEEQTGPYGSEDYVRQQLTKLGNFSDNYPVLGSWIVDGTPRGLSIREDKNPITGNGSRFLPHAII